MYQYVKRAGDVAVSSIALIVLSPVLALVAVGVRCTVGKPVLYTPMRTSKGGKPFKLLKFRSMKEPDQSKGPVTADERLATNEERLVPFGRFIRATSLDELPNFVNILKGEMSLVGPRPLLQEYVPLYNARQAKRHEVLPGLTGLAQVHGRNATTWEERLEWDAKYAESFSLKMDLAIIIKTIKLLLSNDGNAQDGSETMPVFKGTPPKADEVAESAPHSA